jgi:hypothetical protein
MMRPAAELSANQPLGGVPRRSIGQREPFDRRLKAPSRVGLVLSVAIFAVDVVPGTGLSVGARAFDELLEAFYFVVHLAVGLINLNDQWIQSVPAHDGDRSPAEKMAESQKLFQSCEQIR